MAEVESFNLDHTKVHAPYVRVAGRYTLPGGEPVTKFDLRFSQPNREYLTTAAIHTLEHLLAGLMRDRVPNVLDLSPMGCRTGFYLTVAGRPEPQDVVTALTAALEGVTAHHGPIPGATELECGNYRDHNLEAAQAWANRVLHDGLKVQETIPIPDGTSTQRKERR